jgi:hypothetical protein
VLREDLGWGFPGEAFSGRIVIDEDEAGKALLIEAG